MASQYSVEEYYKLGDPVLVEKRFMNLKDLAENYIKKYKYLKRVMEDPVFARDECEWYERHLADLKEGMQNCITAIQALKAKQ